MTSTEPGPLNVLALFAGIGGLELGLERAGMTVVGQVEIDEYCRRVLAKHWPEVPKHDDVRTCVEWWRGERRPAVHVVAGGFPCQDISLAGRRAGIIDGERSSLWSHMAEVVRRVRPDYVLMENVAAVLARGRDGIIPAEIVAADLAALGYDLRWDCVPASAVGAPHRRDRWFGIAYTHASGCGRRSGPWLVGGVGTEELGERPGSSASPFLADADRSGRDGRPGPEWSRGWGQPVDCGEWGVEPDVGRVAHGVPARVDRLRALGNAVVPQVAEYVGRLIVNHHLGSVAA